MDYLTYGDVHHRANALGLIMTRDRLTSRISLRYRGADQAPPEWRNKTLHEIMAIIESIEAGMAQSRRSIRSVSEVAFR